MAESDVWCMHCQICSLDSLYQEMRNLIYFGIPDEQVVVVVEVVVVVLAVATVMVLTAVCVYLKSLKGLFFRTDPEPGIRV